MRKMLIAVLFALVTASACNQPNGGIVGNGLKPVPTSVEVRVVNAATGRPFGLDEVRPVTVTVIPDEGIPVTDLNGTAQTVFQTTTGSALFTFGNGTAPSADAPVALTITAEGPNLISSGTTAHIDSTGNHVVVIRMVTFENPPEGVMIAQLDAGDADVDGTLSDGLGLNTPPDEGAGASLVIPPGAVLTDRDGIPLAGHLTAYLAYFNNTRPGSLRAFPGGLGVEIAKDELGAPQLDAAFISGGFLAVEIQDETGRRVKEFSEPVTLSIQVPGSTKNPETGDPVKNGDTIPVWSYDVVTGVWTFEAGGVIAGPDSHGNYEVDFQATHFSYWNLDWKLDVCGPLGPPAVPLAINLARSARTAGLPLSASVTLPVQSGGYIWKSPYLLTDNQILMYRVPRGVPIHFLFKYGDVTAGEYSTTLDDSCSPLTIPIDVPPKEFENVPISVQGKCVEDGTAFKLPEFSYELWPATGDDPLRGSLVNGTGTIPKVTPGTYDIVYRPLCSGGEDDGEEGDDDDGGLGPLTLRGTMISSSNPIQADYLFECKKGRPANVQIKSFKAAPAVVAPGGQTVLTWESAYASSCSIDGTEVAVSGNRTDIIFAAHSYVLSCKGQQGVNVSAVAKVEVYPPTLINTFTTDKSVILSGQKATLAWTTTNSTACSISGIGTVDRNGSKQVSPDKSRTFILSCQGKAGPVSSSVYIQVGHLPVANPDALTLDEDTSGVINVLSNDTDADHNPLSINSFTQPAHGAVVTDSGGLRYTPSANYNGPDSFTYDVTDNVAGAVTGTVSVTVSPVNDPPVAVSVGTVSAVLNHPSAPIVLSGADTIDQQTVFTVNVTSGPAHGLLDFLSGSSPLSVIYMPVTDYLGPDSFSFTVTDAGNLTSAPVTVNLSVVAPALAQFVVQPGSQELAGATFNFFVIEVIDGDGNRVTTDQTSVITIGVDSGPGALKGTLSQTVRDGVAVFEDVTATAAGTIRISASVGGMFADVSNQVVVSPEFVGEATITRLKHSTGGPCAEVNFNNIVLLSQTGRYVLFHSNCVNLPGVLPDAGVYRLDRVTGEIVAIGASLSASAATFYGGSMSISADGRLATYYTDSSALFPETGAQDQDIFVHDLDTGLFLPVSVTPAGTEAICSDSYCNRGGVMTPSGRYVTFTSASDALIAGDTNSRFDIFIRDRWTGTTRRVSTGQAGEQLNLGASTSGIVMRSTSSNGRYVLMYIFAGLVPADTFYSNLYLKDTWTNSAELIEVNNVGVGADYGAFYGEMFPASYAQISTDGRYVAFSSPATNLVVNDTNGASILGNDVFLRDRLLGTTTRISVSSTGAEITSSAFCGMSGNGRWILFSSKDSSVVPGDMNGARDIFVYDRISREVRRVSVDATGNEANAMSGAAIATDGTEAIGGSSGITGDGRFIWFQSFATNLDPPTPPAMGGFGYTYIAPNPLWVPE